MQRGSHRSETRGGFVLPKYLRSAQATRFLEAAATMKSVQFASIATLYYTGIRRQECCNLDLSDISFADEELLVRQGKGKKDRLLPLHDDLAQILRGYLDDRIPPKSGEALFVTSYRMRVSDNTLYRWVIDCGHRAGLEGVHPHTLRHTLATTVYKKTKNLLVVQRLLGHSSPTTTSIYAATDTDAMRDALRDSF